MKAHGPEMAWELSCLIARVRQLIQAPPLVFSHSKKIKHLREFEVSFRNCL